MIIVTPQGAEYLTLVAFAKHAQAYDGLLILIFRRLNYLLTYE